MDDLTTIQLGYDHDPASEAKFEEKNLIKTTLIS
jgi:hypothetical protein